MAYLCQCRTFHRVLQGPKVGAFAVETQMVPAVAYKDNQLEYKMAGLVQNTGLVDFNLTC